MMIRQNTKTVIISLIATHARDNTRAVCWNMCKNIRTWKLIGSWSDYSSTNHYVWSRFKLVVGEREPPYLFTPEQKNDMWEFENLGKEWWSGEKLRRLFRVTPFVPSCKWKNFSATTSLSLSLSRTQQQHKQKYGNVDGVETRELQFQVIWTDGSFKESYLEYSTSITWMFIGNHKGMKIYKLFLDIYSPSFSVSGGQFYTVFSSIRNFIAMCV